MRVAVTGAGGRVGRAVVPLLVRGGHEVVAVDRRDAVGTTIDAVRTVLGDVGDAAIVFDALEGCDAVVHLAAVPSPVGRPGHVVHNTNVVASYNVLHAAATLGICRVAVASSVNAVGAAFSRRPRFDYFPLDERHPTYAEDPYGLSKWIGEAQAAATARRHARMGIASLRLHAVVPSRAAVAGGSATRSNARAAKELWGYSALPAVARAFVAAITAEFTGHETLWVVAPDTTDQRPSRELAAEYYPDVPIRGDLDGHRGFFDTSRTTQLLGWRHD